VSVRLTAVGILVIGITVGSAATSHSTVKPGASSQVKPQTQATRTPYQRQGTWYEFMLKQFNPDNLDYGSWIEQQRRAFIDARVKNPYFLYGLCMTIGLLLMTAVCTKLWIDHRREMWITA
jgi:hypothetical protein